MAVMPPPPTTDKPPRCGGCLSYIWPRSSVWHGSRRQRKSPPVAGFFVSSVLCLRGLAALRDPHLGRRGGHILGLGSLVDLGQGFAAFDGRGGHIGQFGHGELSGGAT